MSLFKGILPEDKKPREKALYWMYWGTAVAAVNPEFLAKPLLAIKADAEHIQQFGRPRDAKNDVGFP